MWSLCFLAFFSRFWCRGLHCPIGNADIVMEKTDELAKIFRIEKFYANKGWLQCSMRSYMNSADLTSSRDYIKRDHRKYPYDISHVKYRIFMNLTTFPKADLPELSLSMMSWRTVFFATFSSYYSPFLAFNSPERSPKKPENHWKLVISFLVRRQANEMLYDRDICRILSARFFSQGNVFH